MVSVVRFFIQSIGNFLFGYPENIEVLCCGYIHFSASELLAQLRRFDHCGTAEDAGRDHHVQSEGSVFETYSPVALLRSGLFNQCFTRPFEAPAGHIFDRIDYRIHAGLFYKEVQPVSVSAVPEAEFAVGLYQRFVKVEHLVRAQKNVGRLGNGTHFAAQIHVESVFALSHREREAAVVGE